MRTLQLERAIRATNSASTFGMHHIFFCHGFSFAMRRLVAPTRHSGHASTLFAVECLRRVANEIERSSFPFGVLAALAASAATTACGRSAAPEMASTSVTSAVVTPATDREAAHAEVTTTSATVPRAVTTPSAPVRVAFDNRLPGDYRLQRKGGVTTSIDQRASLSWRSFKEGR
jgi:hypothetical protein